MSLTRTIAHQTIIQAGAKVVSVVLGVITVAMLTRFLGQEGYGYYTTAVSYIFFFSDDVFLALLSALHTSNIP